MVLMTDRAPSSVMVKNVAPEAIWAPTARLPYREVILPPRAKPPFSCRDRGVSDGCAVFPDDGVHAHLALAAVVVPSVIDVELHFPVGFEEERVLVGPDEVSGDGLDHAGLLLALTVEVKCR